jgi:hypothetical protein
MKLDIISNKKEINGTFNPNDEFYTPKYAIAPLLKYIKPNSKIWCPFDTSDSLFVSILRSAGHEVIHTHIKDGQDFFTEIPPIGINLIVSNPPYSIKLEVFERLFSLSIPFAMLVGVVGIFESKKRFSMFKDNDFEIMYFDKRISYFRSYEDKKPSLNPPFSSVYITRDLLPNRIVFAEILK